MTAIVPSALLLALLVVPGSSPAQPSEVPDTPETPAESEVPEVPDTSAEAPMPSASLVAESPEGHFAFHSDPRVNLHHFLYHWSRQTLAGDRRLRGRLAIDPVDLSVDLGEDRETWERAATAYLSLAEQDLLFGQGAYRVKRVMAGFDPPAADDPLVEAVETGLPVYLRHWWPRHDASNRATIADLLGRLADHETTMAEGMVRWLRSGWPETAIRTDVVAYSHFLSAYTTDRPPHIVTSSTAADLEGDKGLEILFHEASHSSPLGDNLRPTSLAVAEEMGVEEGNLWHWMIFYSSGEVAREVLGDDYQTYAEAGLWGRGTLGSYRDALAACWRPGDEIAAVARCAQKRLHPELVEPASPADESSR